MQHWSAVLQETLARVYGGLVYLFACTEFYAERANKLGTYAPVALPSSLDGAYS